MPFVAGVDSSTQSTKVEIRDLTTGDIVASSSSPHPAVTPPCSEQDPQSWWVAFENAWNRAVGELAGPHTVAAVSIGGQQHGMVALDDADHPVHPAKLWNDTESAPDAGWLIGQLGGAAAWADAVGSVPVAAFTATKLSWLHRTHPDAWADIAHVLLPHDFLTLRLTGVYTTDRGDASGTGYWSPATGEYRWDLLAIIDADRDWTHVVPTVLGPLDTAGNWNGVAVAAGTGDNMAAALGLGLDVGDAVVSIGTSGTAFTVADRPTADSSGEVAGFADASGRFLPLVCTSNAAKVLDAVARLLGVDHDEFDRLALAARGDRRPVMLPYFDGERTPNRPEATGVLSGLRSDVSREEFARAAVDGVACGLLDALDSLRRHADLDGRLVLTGGGARSRALQAVIAGLVGCPVVVADVDQAVATGAAVQAAAVLQGCDHRTMQQQWGLGSGTTVDHAVDSGDLRERYSDLRELDRVTDPFRVLGLGPDATSDDIRVARRELAKRHHPDRGGDPAAMQAVNEAADNALQRLDGATPRLIADEPGSGLSRDVPSFTVEALPVETFEGLLIVASWVGEVLDDDPPYRLDVHLYEPVECWCRLDVVPDAGSSTVSLTVAGFDGSPRPDILEIRDLWITNLNAVDWT